MSNPDDDVFQFYPHLRHISLEEIQEELRKFVADDSNYSGYIAWDTAVLRTLQTLIKERDEARAALARADALLSYAEWSGYVWRDRKNEPGHYLVAGCPVCFMAKDKGHADGCTLAAYLRDRLRTVDALSASEG